MTSQMQWTAPVSADGMTVEHLASLIHGRTLPVDRVYFHLSGQTRYQAPGGQFGSLRQAIAAAVEAQERLTWLLDRQARAVVIA